MPHVNDDDYARLTNALAKQTQILEQCDYLQEQLKKVGSFALAILKMPDPLSKMQTDTLFEILEVASGMPRQMLEALKDIKPSNDRRRNA